MRIGAPVQNRVSACRDTSVDPYAPSKFRISRVATASKYDLCARACA